MQPKVVHLILIIILNVMINFHSFGQFITEFTTGKTIHTTKSFEISGSIYLDEEWRSGYIENAMNEKTTNLKLRYNALDDVFEVLHEGNIYVLKNSVVRRCVFLPEDGRDKIVFKNGFGNVGENDNPLAYFIVHHDGYSKLLENITIRLSEEIVPGYSQSKLEKKFVPVSSFWLVVPGSVSTKIPLREKPLVAALGDKSKEVSAFIKSNRIRIRTVADVIKILQFYDSIRL